MAAKETAFFRCSQCRQVQSSRYAGCYVDLPVEGDVVSGWRFRDPAVYVCGMCNARFCRRRLVSDPDTGWGPLLGRKLP